MRPRSEFEPSHRIRLIYGGGFSAEATAESYRATRERTRSFIAHLSEADQAKVLGGTAARLYGLVGKDR